MKISEFWQEFKKEYAIKTDSYAAYAFGVDEDGLAQLVLSGKKTATSSLYLAYEFENEPLPQVGAYNMILDSQEQPVCITLTTLLEKKGKEICRFIIGKWCTKNFSNLYVMKWEQNFHLRCLLCAKNLYVYIRKAFHTNFT